jgi:hypothetical protein
MSLRVGLGMRKPSAPVKIKRGGGAPATRSGAAALGALALGAFALGVAAYGAMAIGRLVVGKARFRSVEIDELIVKHLRLNEPEEPSAGSR